METDTIDSLRDKLKLREGTITILDQCLSESRATIQKLLAAFAKVDKAFDLHAEIGKPGTAEEMDAALDEWDEAKRGAGR